MFKRVQEREAGLHRPAVLSRTVQDDQWGKVAISAREVDSPHVRPVTCLDVDPTECRYLLVGSADSNVSIFDLADPVGVRAKDHRLEPIVAEHPPREGHAYAVNCVQWYPFDTGLFISGGMDGKVLLWDTNTLQVAQTLEVGQGVHAVHMSSRAQAHQLIACASDSRDVRLCDPRSGATSHVLFGHRDAVWSVRWSPASEFALASGSVDGTVRVWDVRRAGHLAVLDQHNDLEARLR